MVLSLLLPTLWLACDDTGIVADDTAEGGSHWTDSGSTGVVGTAPGCAITAPEDDAGGAEGEVVIFEALVSDEDQETRTLAIGWQSNLDGDLGPSTPDSAGEVALPTTGLSVGTHLVTLTVTDDEEQVCTDFVLYTIGTPPTVTVTAPDSDQEVAQGSEVAFEAAVADAEDPATALAVLWESDRDGELSTTGADSSGSLRFATSALSPGTHTVQVTVTDPLGLSAVASVTLGVNSAPDAPGIALSPNPATTTDDLVLVITAESSDPEGDAVTYTAAWEVDGLGWTGVSDTGVPATDTARDQVWTVRVTPDDGLSEGPVATASITIDNTPPVLDSVTLGPDPAGEADTLTCTPGTSSDADEDPVSLETAWTIDGSDAGVSADTLTGDHFDSGSVVSCAVTPGDGTDAGLAVSSNSVTIANTPPVLDSVSLTPDPATEADTLTCTAGTLSDVDGTSGLGTTVSWTVDGVDPGVSSDTLGPEWFARDQVVQCSATPTDGSDTGDPVASNSVTIANTAPSVDTVVITPDPAWAGDALTCTASGYADLDGDPDASTRVWTVDGTPSGTDATLSSAAVGGQTITCTVTPSDGTDDGVPVSASLVLDNTPPVLDSVNLGPDPAREADSLTCTPGSSSDADGESVSFTTTWQVAGVDPGVTSSTLDGTWFDRDDAVRCTVTPTDGSDSGDPVASNTVTIANTAPSITRVLVTPTDPSASDALTCVSTGWSDADGDAEATTIAWTVAGSTVGTGATLAGVFVRGDSVTCTATPDDGTDTGTPVSGSVTIANAAPVITAVSLSPTSPGTADTLTASVSASDPDGDSLSLSHAWTVGGSPIGETGSSLDGATWFEVGDVIGLSVTASDGTDTSVSVSAVAVTVANTPPDSPSVSIEPSEPEEGTDDLVCVIDSPSSDADGDAVSYAIVWDLDGTTWGGATSTTTESGDTIAAVDTAEGDVWTCTVTPSDSDDDGTPSDTSVSVVAGFPTGVIGLADAGIKLSGAGSTQYFGWSISSAGDVNADGIDDVIIGDPNESSRGTYFGAAFVFLGPITGNLSSASADAKRTGEAYFDMAGSVSDAGDVNGDGYGDVLVAAILESTVPTYSGAVYLNYGPVSGDRSLSYADVKITGEDHFDQVGWLSPARDHDGDGYDDFWAGSSLNPWPDYYGAAYLLQGPLTGNMSMGDADAKLVGENFEDHCGRVAGVGDIDGDGWEDVMVGAPDHDGTGTDAGAVYLVLGPVSGEVDLSSADAKLTGLSAADNLGDAVAGVGDQDGDGHDDVLIGAPGESSGGSDAGAAYLMHGPLSGTLSMGSADVTITGEASGDNAGSYGTVATAGDVNEDGVPDLLIGAPYESSTEAYAGAAYLVFGPVTADMSLGDADVMYTGEVGGDVAGIQVDHAGDVDGDGVPDFLIGAYGHQGLGAVYVVHGG